MKSFSEYIKEAYNFRLGGSQKKGYDQTKKFEDLEIGDTVFVYDKYDKIHELEVLDIKDSSDMFKENGMQIVFNLNHKITWDIENKDTSLDVYDDKLSIIVAVSTNKKEIEAFRESHDLSSDLYK